ncbi:MAG: hypothetical protein MK052_10720 [Alphaproteobacteria bacterium]|nr:hypothetical protein [Alphaproteobacteria bacterium]
MSWFEFFYFIGFGVSLLYLIGCIALKFIVVKNNMKWGPYAWNMFVIAVLTTLVTALMVGLLMPLGLIIVVLMLIQLWLKLICKMINRPSNRINKVFDGITDMLVNTFTSLYRLIHWTTLEADKLFSHVIKEKPPS